jgi:hypothetical protein
MGELGPLAASLAPRPAAASGQGGTARALPPPPAPVATATAAATAAPAPAVQVAVAGLELEAWLWPHAAGRDAPDGAAALRGPARLVPLSGPGQPPTAVPASTGSPGAWIATVLGPAVGEGLLARAGDALFWLPGPRPGLPPGARLLVTWRSPPAAALARPPELELETARAEAGPRAPEPSAPTALARAAPEALPPGVPEEAAEPPAPRSEARPPGTVAAGAVQTAAAPPEAAPLAAAMVGLASLLGLAARPVGEEGGGSEACSGEQGRSRLEIDFPELGRVRLELAWSGRAIELRLAGPAGLTGEERSGLVRAFADGLELSGARGRLTLLAGRAGRPVAWTAAEPDC